MRNTRSAVLGEEYIRRTSDALSVILISGSFPCIGTGCMHYDGPMESDEILDAKKNVG